MDAPCVVDAPSSITADWYKDVWMLLLGCEFGVTATNAVVVIVVTATDSSCTKNKVIVLILIYLKLCWRDVWEKEFDLSLCMLWIMVPRQLKSSLDLDLIYIYGWMEPQWVEQWRRIVVICDVDSFFVRLSKNQVKHFRWLRVLRTFLPSACDKIIKYKTSFQKRWLSSYGRGTYGYVNLIILKTAPKQPV